jgi:sialate O-acetylesterase
MKKIFLLLLLATSANAQLKLAHIFADHAVLQRQKPIAIWGWASPKETVKVTLASQSKETVADAEGKWILRLAALEAGGPYKMVVKTATSTLTLEDILIGEVWLCSGQSNMEWSVNASDNAPTEKRAATIPQIRHFKVQNDLALKPLKDLKTAPQWVVCSPETVGDFTAVGYFFAKELAQKLQIPIGLVNSSWGGSQAEGWISKESMESSEQFKNYAQTMPKTWEEANAKLDQVLKQQVLGKIKDVSASDQANYLSPDYDFKQWYKGSTPGAWDWQGLWAYRGLGYMAKYIDVPADMTAKETTLGLGINNSPSQVYINGKLVFDGVLKGARKIKIPANTWKSGQNTMLTKFGITTDPSWFGVGITGSAEDFFLQQDEEKIMLGGNDWYLMPALADNYTYAQLNNNIGTSIYNAMIAPIVPFAMRGILWYQGETNAARSFQYRKTFPLLIQDWRKQWAEELPFYFVQLSSYGSNESANNGSNWAELREAQSLTLALPQTGMAITTDIGNPTDIHPTNKQDVGKRLSAIALAKDYGLKVPYQSPLYESLEVKANLAVVTFKNVTNGLMAKDKFGYVRGFEIAGADQVFYYAQAQIVGNKVIVQHSKVQNPVAVRYAWSDSPDKDANLFSTEGLPANGFRTDTWKGITEEVQFK